jgi:pimeloyl-ACP methyl ester carboxylesterase
MPIADMDTSVNDTARGCVTLVVPGAYAHRLRGPMAPNLARLRAMGFDARLADFDTGACMAIAARAVDAEVRGVAARGKKAILVGHSSGAVAITVALALAPELARHVHRVVLMQTTYLGSPIADLIVRAPRARAMIERLSGGDYQAIVDVTTPVRRAFVEAHPYPASDVPTVALVTRRLSPRSPLFPFQLFLEVRHGLDSDGLVPTEHQRVPGAFVVERALDHAQAVIGRRAGDLTNELLDLALDLTGRTTDPARRR